LTSALVGILTLLLFYPFARAYLPRRWALVAVALLAVFPWHVHFSRLGFRVILAPMAVCLAGWALAHWLRRGTLAAAVLTGAATAFAHYTYTASHIMPVAVGVCAAWALMAARGTDAPRRRAALGIGLGVAAGLVVIAPLLVHFASTGTRALSRVAQVGPGAGDFTVAGNAVSVVLFLLGIEGDMTFKHGPPGRPPYGLFLAPFVIAGLLHLGATARARRGMGMFALLALAGFLAATLFSQSAPNKLRSLGAVPVLVLAFTLGLRLFVAGLRGSGVPRGAARVAVAGVFLLFLWAEAPHIIYGWHRNPTIHNSFSGPFTQVALWATGQPLPAALAAAPGKPRGEVVRQFDLPFFLPTSISNHATVRYLAGEAVATRPLDSLEAALVRSSPGDAEACYLLVTQNAPSNQDILLALAPGTAPVALLANPVDGTPWGVIARVPRRSEPFTSDERELAARYFTDR